MKKTLFAISAIAVLLGFTACTSENEILEPQVSGKTITIKAYTESSDTRTALSQNGAAYDVVWSSGDQIKIGPISDIYAEFTLSDGDGTTSGTFTRTGGAQLEEGTLTAYYPMTYDGTNWPTAQTYTAGNITGSPMKATFTYTKDVEPSLSFKNEGGILRLNLKGEAKVTSIKISATGLDPITLDCGSTGVELNTTTATPFHIAVPGSNGTEEQPGTAYSGLKIEITDNTGAVCTKTLKSDKTITVQRSKITDITLTAGSFEHAYVELAGTKWATENVGYVNGVEASATHATYGYYYTYDNALHAAASWGSNWELPTIEQWEALKDNCTWSWQTDYSFGGKTMKGYLVTDENNGNSIFLPAAGSCEPFLSGQGIYGDYWSSTPVDSENAYELWLEGDLEMCGSDRSCGFSVRPVFTTTGTAEVKSDAGITGNKVNWVQLWAGGPKFAEFNVGATSATDDGGYYTWGGTSANGEGIVWTDDHNNGTDNLSRTDDTATNLWGSKWRMPTQAELQGLLDNCDVEWTTVNGVNGRKFTGKAEPYSSNSVFLPAAGFYFYDDVFERVNYGYYWSSTPNGSSYAYYLDFDSDRQRVNYFGRSYGYSVRAVLNESAE